MPFPMPPARRGKRWIYDGSTLIRISKPLDERNRDISPIYDPADD